MAKLGNGTMAILWSAPARVYSRDVDYEYRQDSDLLYLTGIEQPDTMLVLLPGSRTPQGNPLHPAVEPTARALRRDGFSAPKTRALAPASTPSS